MELPRRGDPRLYVAGVTITLHVLGQVALGFHVSIPQILSAILACALVEAVVVWRRRRVLAWPSSAILTGSGVALILRDLGTSHGDWWSMRSWHLFAVVAVASLATKYFVKIDGRQVFNPSNVGLALAFVLLGSSRVEPLDFYWGPLTPGLVAAYAAILVGGVAATQKLGLLQMSAAFYAAFAAGNALLAATGHCITARWAFEPVCDGDYLRTVATSPEVLVFMFFMITDPRVVPRGIVARVVFGASVGAVAVLLMAPQSTEFGAKVALLMSLVVCCALRRRLETLLPAPGSATDDLYVWARQALVGHRGASAVAAASLAVLVPVAGIPSSDVPGTDVPVVARPSVRIAAAEIPPISISRELRRLDPSFDEADARVLARDLLADLELIERGLTHADPSLLSSAAHGRALEVLRGKLGEVRRHGKTTWERYEIDELDAVITYPGGPQSGARYGFVVRGRISSIEIGPAAGVTRVGSSQRGTRTFALVRSDRGEHLVADFLG